MSRPLIPRRREIQKLPARSLGKLRLVVFDHERYPVNSSMRRFAKLLLRDHCAYLEFPARPGTHRFKRDVVSIDSDEALRMGTVLLACGLPIARCWIRALYP